MVGKKIVLGIMVILNCAAFESCSLAFAFGGYERGQVQEEALKLVPWFQEQVDRFRGEPKLTELVARLNDRSIVCELNVSGAGNITSISVRRSSGDAKLDSQALSLITGLRAFDPPPNTLVVNRGLLVTFFKPPANEKMSPVRICLNRWSGCETARRLIYGPDKAN